MQTDVVVDLTAHKITGTLHKVTTGTLADTWGEGYFMALQFSDVSSSVSSLLVGLNPSVSSGLVEVIGDPDMNGAFKVTNKLTQMFKVVAITPNSSETVEFDRSELVLDDGE